MTYKFIVKDDCDLNDTKHFQPATWILFNAAMLYCYRNNLEFRISSLINDRKNIETVSTTHRDGRAFDLSHRRSGNWSNVHRNRLAYEINRDYSDIGAISFSDNVSRPCCLKSDHFHFQVRRDACLDKFIKI